MGLVELRVDLSDCTVKPGDETTVADAVLSQSPVGPGLVRVPVHFEFWS